MATREELKIRLAFRKEALFKLRKAYIALVEGGVKSYTIDDRTLTRFDLDSLLDDIKGLEEEVDELEALLHGRKARKAFGVLPRDW